MKFSSNLFTCLRVFFGKKTDKQDLVRKSFRGAVTGITISMIPILIVLVVSDGMINGITSRYIELSTYHKQIIPFDTMDFSEMERLASKIRDTTKVKEAWVETQSFGVAFSEGVSSGAAIRAVDPMFLSSPQTLEYLEVIEGNILNLDLYGAVIGKELSNKLDIRCGEIINLITLRSNENYDYKPRVSVFIVRAIVSSGYRELDANWIFINKKAANRIFSPASAKTFIGIRTNDPFDHEFEKEIESGQKSELTKSLLISSNYNASVYDWRELERGLLGSLQSTRSILLVIMALVVMVAAINTGGTLFTLIMERSNEIAILKSMGMGSGDIVVIFILLGTIIGILGVGFGIFAGIFFAININESITILEWLIKSMQSFYNMIFSLPASGTDLKMLNPDYYLESIPIVLDLYSLFMISAGTIFISLLASILPAIKAVKLTPNAILQHK